MMPIAAGWVVLGPRHVAPVDGVMIRPPPGAPGSGAPGRPAGPPPGRPAGSGAPPAGAPGPAGPGGAKLNYEAWQFLDGMRLEPRRVWVEAFRMDRYEVTRAAYRAFLADTGYRPPFVAEPWAEADWNWNGIDFPVGTGEHPVVLTSRYDAEAYCTWAGKHLPGEAEWQLAALGTEEASRVWPWGEAYEAERLNHGQLEEPVYDDSDGWKTTSPVGSFPSGRGPNGLDDAFGNAWEWTADFRVESWDSTKGPALYAAVRGGSYYTDLRPDPGGERHQFLAELRRKTSGFRCASE